jgi:hypothetical protein
MKHDENLLKHLVQEIRSIKRGQNQIVRYCKSQNKRIEKVEDSLSWHRTIWILIVTFLGINK